MVALECSNTSILIWFTSRSQRQCSPLAVEWQCRPWESQEDRGNYAGRKRGSEGGRRGREEGMRERGSEGGRRGGREERKEGRRERGREGGREGVGGEGETAHTLH